MKVKFLSCLLILLVLGLPLMAAAPGKLARHGSTALSVDNTTYIDANNILMFVTNHGNFGRDLADVFGHDYGTYFPYSGDPATISSGEAINSPYYAGGLWIGAIDSATGDTLVTVSEYDSEYVPGFMEDSTFSADIPEYRVYKLFSDSTHRNTPNQAWLDWPVDQGAPTRLDTFLNVLDTTIIDSVVEVPDLIGDQMCWAIFNDADPDQHANMETAPLGVEVRQTVFAYDREDPLGNCIFIKWQVVNRGPKTLEQCFFSVWSDPDLGLAGDDLVGTDVDLNLAYTYNATNADSKYGSRPPCIGLDFFQGPLVFTGDDADTAKMWGTLWPGYQNMGLFSFNKYINGTDPDNAIESYWYMLGLDAKSNGAPVVDPTTGEVTRYQVPGDPVANTGWLDIAPDDRRHMQTTGPLTFRPGDSTEILAAIVVGQGGDRKSSIKVMKYYDTYAQSAYDNDFDLLEAPTSPVVSFAQLDGQLVLRWTDTSEVHPGDYPFEGYSIYQGQLVENVMEWTRIANFDVVNGEAEIQDLVVDPETGALETRSIRFGSDSGIKRYLVLEEDFINGGPLLNMTNYNYRVEAYSYDPEATPKVAFSATNLVVKPQWPVVDTVFNQAVGDDVPVTHTGPSGGSVTVEIVDPTILTGHNYEVTFGTYEDSTYYPEDTTDFYYTYTTLDDTCWFDQEIDSLGNPYWVAILCVDTVLDSVDIDPAGYEHFDQVYWELTDTDLDSVLLTRQINQTGDDDYLITDGFVVRVSGPAPGIASFQVVQNAAGPVDPPEPGAMWFGGFPVPTFNDPDGYITEAQQSTNAMQWGIHTADNGGTCGGGAYGTYEAFLSRGLRDGSNADAVGAYDWEVRFTGANANPGVNGSYAVERYYDWNVYWVPFELWRVGIGTLSDPSDDVRLVPYVIDDGDDNTFNMESWGCVTGTFGGDGEHSVSGGDNDPFSDWFYWRLPADASAGEAGYNTAEAAMLGGTFQANEGTLVGAEVFARMVFVSWNGGVEPPFEADHPEQGTIFRMITHKPNSAADVFSFQVDGPTRASKNEDALAAIKAVPNPFYLYGPYDPAVGNRQIYFSHLPSKCTITIYNLAGDYINRIEKDDPGTSLAYWNVQTENNLPVASGIYIYVVEAPGFGTKIGKMAVFVEDEVLPIY